MFYLLYSFYVKDGRTLVTLQKKIVDAGMQMQTDNFLNIWIELLSIHDPYSRLFYFFLDRQTSFKILNLDMGCSVIHIRTVHIIWGAQLLEMNNLCVPG